MSIALYRKGSTHEIKGITCEIGTFDAQELDAKLKEGWHTDPAKLMSDTLESIEKQNKEGNDIKTDKEISNKNKSKSKGKR